MPSPHTKAAPKHHSLDIQDFLSQFSRSPLEALHNLGRTIATQAIHHWWSIVLVVILFALVRWGLDHERQRNIAQETMRRAAGRGSRRRYARRSMTVSLLSLIVSIVFIIVLAGLCGIALSPGTFSWVIGSISLTVAFVARPYLADAVAAFRNIAGDAYGIGDYLDIGFGIEGTVTGISLWTTRLRDAHGTVWEVHNAEMVKFGNRTKSSGRILSDITLIPHDDNLIITSRMIDEWEHLISKELITLRSTLNAVDSLARNTQPDDDVDAAEVASTVPQLVPNMSVAQMMKIRELDPDATDAIPVLRTTLASSTVSATPLLRDIEVLGLVSAEPHEATLRVRVVVVDQRTRSYALAVVRRTLFDAFSRLGVATRFADVPDSELIS